MGVEVRSRQEQPRPDSQGRQSYRRELALRTPTVHLGSALSFSLLVYWRQPNCCSKHLSAALSLRQALAKVVL